MAQKRMFSLSVTDTDKFLDMSASAQALYFHLGMHGDDDGFVASPKKIARGVGCNDDDLRLLASKGYIIPFESGVIVIVDWSINNTLKNDRYHKTIFSTERALLSADSAGRWVLDSNLESERKQIGTSLESELNETKLNRTKQNREKAASPPARAKRSDFDLFWQAYPKKVGKEAARKAFKQVKAPLESLLTAIERQKCGNQWTTENGRFIPNPATWLNQGRWQDEVSPPAAAKSGQAVQRHDAPLSDIERQAVARMLGKQLPT